jgi:hypothetical protein
MSWERGALADMMGSRVVYRNLEPVDPGIAGLQAAWQAAGLDHYYIPRKTTPEYARVIWHFMHEAQRLRGVGRPIERVLMVGDSARNDGAVAHNLAPYCAARGFIGMDALARPRQVAIEQEIIMVANRWNALVDLMAWLEADGLACDEAMAMVIDLDKTSLGARGRNDGVIDAARVQAAERMARDTLGDALDEAAFRSLYARLNQTRYHYLTEDNQDYVAYICLMVAGQALPEQRFWAALEDGSLKDIQGFCARCEQAAADMADGLRQVHREVYDGVAAGDPTPFKAFRRLEFLETIARMDALPDEATPEAVLAREIVLTAEVSDLACKLAAQGVLVFGLSDKPDEASIPDAEAAAQGLRAIHETPMKVYGERLF